MLSRESITCERRQHAIEHPRAKVGDNEAERLRRRVRIFTCFPAKMAQTLSKEKGLPKVTVRLPGLVNRSLERNFNLDTLLDSLSHKEQPWKKITFQRMIRRVFDERA